MVLLIIASASTPTWDQISFLDVSMVGESGTTRWGIFGSSLSNSIHLGYRIPDADNRVLHALTYTLILVPISAGLSGLALLFGICGAAHHRAGTVLMTITSMLAFVNALAGWVLSMVLFGITRKRLNEHALPYEADFGNAEWIGELCIRTDGNPF